jgi:hypothetical protein
MTRPDPVPQLPWREVDADRLTSWIRRAPSAGYPLPPTSLAVRLPRVKRLVRY